MPALESLPGALLTRVFGHRPAPTRAVLCIAGFAVASVTVASVRRPPLRLLPRRCLGLETVALVMVALVRRPLLPCSEPAPTTN